MLQLEKKEQESLEKAKQYAAQKRELKKRQKDVEQPKYLEMTLSQLKSYVESSESNVFFVLYQLHWDILLMIWLNL